MIKKQSGSVLTIALVLIFAISIFAFASSGVINNDFLATKKYKNNITAGFLARAGIEKAIQVLKHDNGVFDALNDSWNNNESSFKNVTLDDGFFTVGYGAENEKRYGVVDEESKLNINLATKEMLMLLPGLGQDEVGRLLNARGKAKFHRPVELVSRAIITEDVYAKIKGFVTVWGDGRINVNTASREVLASVPGLYVKEVDAILAFRKGHDGIEGTSDDTAFKSIADLQSLSGFRYVDVNGLFKISSSNFYIVSEGLIYKNTVSRGKRIIEAVVKRDNNKITIEYWNMS